jgi:predicted dehydrogenase
MPQFKKANEIKAGVIGYGGTCNMGEIHLQEMQKAGISPVAVSDLEEARLEIARKDFPGIETYTDFTEMLNQSEVNLIAIITPHNTHAELALECLKAGKNVVCEKPLAITTEECDQMIAAAEEHGVIVTAYHNRHWDGCILQAVDQICNKGLIGNVLRIEAHMGGYSHPGDWWRSSKSISGGILYDWGVHLLEYSLQILDGKMKEVSGFATSGYWANQTRWGNDTNEDEATAVVRFDNNQFLSLRITNIDSNPPEGVLEITGTEGTYIMDHQTWRTIAHENSIRVIKEGRNRESESWRFYQNIVDHLTEGEPLIITGEWARRPIHILDLASRSAREGKALQAKYE